MHSIQQEARPGRGEDRLAVQRLDGCTVIILADGAGGQSGGAAAADVLCRSLATTTDAEAWPRWLSAHDRLPGLAAAVVLSIADDRFIRGASVGDCEAWYFSNGRAVELTAQQRRKPLLGEGRAQPVPFSLRATTTGTLVVASDGLWKYMKQSRIVTAASLRPLHVAAANLVDGVRLPSGALQDDVAIVLCEVP